MNLFGPRQIKPDLALADLKAQVERIESTVRQLALEQVTMHDQVRKWMRRAVAAERAVERALDDREAAPVARPAPIPDWKQLRGRDRVLARRALRKQESATHTNGAEDADGVHS